MSNVLELIKLSILSNVKEYESIRELLNPIVEKYFNDDSYRWENYDGWDFIEGGKRIEIYYSYQSYIDDNIIEHGSTLVALDDILKLIEI